MHENRSATIVIGLVAIAVYAITLFNGFAWDDVLVIVKNPILTGSTLTPFSSIDTARETDHTPYYRPLTLLSFLFEYRLHGFNPTLMHLANLILHILNAILSYFLARSITAGHRAALITALLFAVHPINTEGVAFLSGGRNTLLATFFAMSAYLLHAKSIATHHRWSAPIASVLLLAALLSKETAIAIIPFIFAIEVRSQEVDGPNGWGRAARRLALYILPLFVYFLLRSHALANAGPSMPISPGLFSRLTDNIYIIPRYLLTILWPPAASMNYIIPDDLHTLALPLAAGWIAIIAAGAWLFTRGSKTMRFGMAWLVIFWLPTSGIIPFPSAHMADRYIYLAGFGLWLVLGELSAKILSADNRAARYGLATVASILVLLAICTIMRNRVWENDITLFSDYVEKHPEEAFGHHNLGTAFLDLAKDPERADREFAITLALNPTFPLLHTQMGYIRLLQGKYDEALLHYDEALIQNPEDAEALLNRGAALEKLGRYREAAADFTRFLKTPNRELDKARPGIQSKLVELGQHTQ
ncbi:tetratricopeptide repeat protein [Geotalea toluenoxydans]|uniref:tetratricopeptide repeat protein n=1 Tax=Geotalea toluenoxydans TaxID=421624 RepID=UPI000B0A8356|nr:tetratricopeptide repeat protein [Geotalea toluenoxydans]